MKILVSACAVVFSVLFLPNAALAWGDLGHEVVCEIAYRELNQPALEKVKTLMALDGEFRIYSKSCTWPDHPRKRDVEHYVNVSRASSQIGSDPCPTSDKCVVSAIEGDIQGIVLMSDPQEQLELIKFLGHWVGDLHQPAHASFKDDQGAGKINVTDPCNGSLHGVWDSCIIEETLGSDAQTIVDTLHSEIRPGERQQWIPPNIDRAAVIGWANESLAISLQPSVGYCVMVGSECWYEPGNREFTGAKKTVTTDEAYLRQHSPTAKARLQMAGVRLGAILNKLFDPDYQLDQVEAASLDLNDLMARRPATAIIPADLSAIVNNSSGRLSTGVSTLVPTATDDVLEQLRLLNARMATLEHEIQSLKAPRR